MAGYISKISKQVSFIVLFATLVIGKCFSQKNINRNQNPEKPNIILFVSDDHGTDALGCYGNNVIKTPNIDKLASEGVKFNYAFCTSASCAASRSVILTGKYSHSTGVYGHTHDYHHFKAFKNTKSLPNILNQNGYKTARIGKYHLAPEEVYKFDEILKANPRNTFAMADSCKKILNSEKPFFLYFCTDDPHRGAPFKPEKWNMPNSFGNKEEGYPGVKAIQYNPEKVLVPDFLPDTKECREELAQYYQSVSRIDQGFGRLMEILQETGKEENTIVIYISDNGIAFPGAKTTLYEPGMRLPCIIKDPVSGIKNLENNALISWVDLAPTILDMAHIDFETESFHGKSFRSIINQESPKGRNEIYASHTFHEITMYYPMRVYRTNQYKLIWNIAYQLEYPFASDLWAASTWQGIHQNNEKYFGKRTVKNYLNRPEFELYDLLNDPGELLNLANNKEYETVLISMKQKIKDFQKQTSDPWMIMWDHDPLFQGSGVGL